MKGSLLVAGTTSDAGKSVVAAGICRWLARQGVSVAPFKAQNMSNNSVVTADGGEIGRAQGLQAAACGLEPSVEMNPVLLKPGSDRESHVVVLGRPYGEAGATGYRELAPELQAISLGAYDFLADRHDVIVCEGAGSPTEINLRGTDFVNMGLARARGIPVVVVADIDRGGVFAALFGTLALLEPADQALVSAFIVNKFRGDQRLLAPGLTALTALTGRSTLGVLPWVEGLSVDVEDGQSLVRSAAAGTPYGAQVLRVAVVDLPRVSNSTDVDALAAEPGVRVSWTASPSEVADADLVVLPGTRATIADLEWLRAKGIAAALVERSTIGRPVLGICGGYQMLARTIVDGVESATSTAAGLGLLPVDVTFSPAKTVRRVAGEEYGERVDTAYEIHHGVGVADPGATPFLDGCRAGAVWGTTWHGALESDGFRRAFLREVAALAGRAFEPAPDTCFAAVRETALDTLATLVADHLDTRALAALIEGGAPSGLPVLPPGAPM